METQKIKPREIPSVRDAFDIVKKSPKKAFAILAPTGGGKTTESANLVVERLRKKQCTVYVANQKNDLYQFRDTLFELLTEAEKKKVQIICREADKEIEDSTLIVLTHKTYFKRKGFSNLHYATMLWLGKHEAWVIIDEVQAYVRDQNITLTRGGRFYNKKFKDHSISRKEIISKCLVSAGRGNCAYCNLCKENYLASDTNGIIEARIYIQGKTGSDYPPRELPKTETKNKVQHNTLIIEEIAQKPKSQRFYRCKLEKEEISPGLTEIFEDLLTWSYKPKKYTFTPITQKTKKPVNWEKIRQEFEIVENTSENEREFAKGKKEIKKQYHFPQAACDVEIYELQDTSSLQYVYQHAEKVICLGATIRQDDGEFLHACCPDMEFLQIEKSNHQIDELSVVIFQKKLDVVNNIAGEQKVKIQPILDQLKDGQKALIFTPKKSDAEELYKSFPRNYPVAKLNGEDITIEQKAEDRDYKIGITWELGPLGLSINRPNDYLAITDGESYLPIIAYGHDSKITPEKVEAGYRRKAEDTLIQCGGRILRGKGRKVILLHNMEKISLDLEVILKAWQGMVATPIKFITIEESQEYLTKVVTEYLTTGSFPQEKETEYVKEQLAQKAQREMSKKERDVFENMTTQQKAEYYHKRKEEKRQKILDRLIAKGRELKSQGKKWKNWGEIYDTLHINRYKELEATIK